MLWNLARKREKLEDGNIIDAAGIALRLKVNRRARRISLRIDSRSGEVIVSAPRPRDLAQAVEFAHSRRDWIEAQLYQKPDAKPFQSGLIIPYLSHEVELIREAGTKAARFLESGHISALVAGGDEAGFHRRIERFLRREALHLATAAVTRYAQALGVEDVKISLFDPKGRWGSCTPSRKTIRLSWRLIMAPPMVFDYVCAHEAAHLKHPNQSEAFWNEVRRLFGDYEAARGWLKTHGAELLSYG